MRLVLPIATLVVGFALLILRLVGAFGNPLVVDGGLLLALILVGFGAYRLGTSRASA